MTYIYDILLNYTDDFYYDFYEWIDKDNLINIKKIPIIYTDKNVVYDFIYFNIKVDKKILDMIDNKSIFLRKDKDRYNYSVLLSSGEKTIGICFNSNGFIKYKSSLLPDEEEDANNLAIKQKRVSLKYKKYNYNFNKVLRCDIDNKKRIIKELKKEFLNKEYDKLKYIYYEIYNDFNDDITYVYNKLLKEIDENINVYNYVFNELEIK